MRVAIFAGPATTGKTSVIRHSTRKLLQAGHKAAFLKLDVPGALRLVNLLVARGRASTIRRVSEEFNRRLNASRGVMMATVISAVPLTEDETAAIRTRVEAMAGASIELRTEVDPGLIGGLTIQVRDQLLDASIRGRLVRLRDQLHAGGRLR
jgi:ATP synthase F1 delta subunit